MKILSIVHVVTLVRMKNELSPTTFCNFYASVLPSGNFMLGSRADRPQGNNSTVEPKCSVHTSQCYRENAICPRK